MIDENEQVMPSEYYENDTAVEEDKLPENIAAIEAISEKDRTEEQTSTLKQYQDSFEQIEVDDDKIEDENKLTPDEVEVKVKEIEKKNEKDRSENDKAFLETQKNNELETKYEELIAKEEGDLTNEDKEFIEEHRPLTTIEVSQDLIEEKLGFVIPEEMEFEDSTDGMVNLFKYVSQTSGSNAIAYIMKKFPSLKKQYDYLASGGKPDKYNQTWHPQVEYENVEILEEEDYDTDKYPLQERNRILILTDDLRGQGFDDEKITKTIEIYKEKGILGRMSKMANEKLTTIQKTKRDNLQLDQDNILESNKKLFEASRDAHVTYLDKVESIGGIPISETNKKEFHSFRFNARQDSLLPEIPIVQEIFYHALNSESELYRTQKYQNLRNVFYYFAYMHDKDPNFIDKLAQNRAKTIATKKRLPPIGGGDAQTRFGQGRTHRETKKNQGDIRDTEMVI